MSQFIYIPHFFNSLLEFFIFLSIHPYSCLNLSTAVSRLYIVQPLSVFLVNIHVVDLYRFRFFFVYHILIFFTVHNHA